MHARLSGTQAARELVLKLLSGLVKVRTRDLGQPRSLRRRAAAARHDGAGQLLACGVWQTLLGLSGPAAHARLVRGCHRPCISRFSMAAR